MDRFEAMSTLVAAVDGGSLNFGEWLDQHNCGFALIKWDFERCYALRWNSRAWNRDHGD